MRDFDTGLGRRIDLLAQLRGHLGYGGLVQHWDQWQAGNEQVKGLLSADILAIRKLSPAWQSDSPGPEEREALASVLRTVDAYEAALKQGAKGEVDTANQIQQSLTRISGILQQERASGADCVEDAVWRLGFTVGGVMLFSAVLLIPIRESGLSMRRLADGDKTTLVPFVDKTDEMGEMARTTGEISEHINEITAKTRTAVVALKGVVETRHRRFLHRRRHQPAKRRHRRNRPQCPRGGDQAEAIVDEIIRDYKGNYILAVEGNVPLADNGWNCFVGGRSFKHRLQETARHAKAVIAWGTCASFGCVQAARPNPTQSTPISKLVEHDGVSFPIKSGHGCIGCSEEGFWDRGPFYERLPDMRQFGIEANADTVGKVTALGLGAAVAVHTGISVVRKALGSKSENGDEKDDQE